MVKRKFLSLLLFVLSLVCFATSALTFNFSGNAISSENAKLQRQSNFELTGNYVLNDLKGFSENNFYNNGLLLSTTQEGAGYKIAEGCEKEFSFVAVPIATDLALIDLNDFNAVDTVKADFSQLSLIFNGEYGQTLVVKFVGAKGSSGITNEIIQYSVFYNGKDVGITGKINQSFRTVINGIVKPLYFYINFKNNFIAFDKAGKNSQQIVDLSTILGLSLDKFSVEVKIEGLTNAGDSEKSAKLAILELCGQALNGEKVKPVINQYVVSNGVLGAKYTLPKVYAYDVMLEQNISDEISFSVFNGQMPIDITEGSFKPEQVGEYEIIASINKDGGLLNSNSQVITVYKYKPQVDFEFNDEFVKTCNVYDTITIPSVRVQSELFLEEVVADVIIKLNDKVLHRVENIVEPFDYRFTNYGEITILYSVVDYFGYSTNYSIVINVENVPSLQNVSLPEIFSYNTSFEFINPVMVYNGVYYKVYTEIVTPSGKLIKNASGKIEIDEIGDYSITYYTLVNGEQLTYKYVIKSVLSGKSIIKGVNDIVSITPNCSLPEYSVEGNGVEVLGNASGATFTFNDYVDLTKFTENDTLLSLQVLNNVSLSEFNKVIVTFTDINDLNNKVQVRLLRNNTGVSTGSDQYSYVTAKYKGSFSGISYSGSTPIVQHVDYGGTVNWCSFNGLKYSNRAEFILYFDYENRCIYTGAGRNSLTKRLVLDLDDSNHVGAGNEWNGFSEGKAYVTVTLEGLKSKGGVIVTNFANTDLSGKVLVDETNPIGYLSCYDNDETLPKAEKGRKYTLPHFITWDFLDKNPDVQMLLYKGNKENLIDLDADDLSFIPSEVGKYYIEYKVIDNNNNYFTKILTFDVLEKLEKISVSFKTAPEIAKIGTLYYIPEVEVSGGSDIVSIEEKVIYNGNDVSLSDSRKLRINQSGKIEIVVKVVDYLGNIYDSSIDTNNSLVINVVSADSPIIEVENVPTVVYNGEILVLPKYDVYNENKQQSNVSKKVEVNGVDVTETMTYTVNQSAGTILTVKYYAIGETTQVRTFEVLVLDPTYLSDFIVVKNSDGSLLNSMDNVKVVLGKTYLEYIFSDSKELCFPQNLVTDGLILKLGINPLYSGSEYFDIYLRDSFDESNVIFLRICKDGYLEINGDSTNRIKINIDLTVDNAYLYFIYNNRTKELCSETGALLAKIDRNVDGFRFDGFSQSLAKLSVKIPACDEDNKSSIRVMQIANQTFMSSFKNDKPSKYSDRTGPVIRFEKQMMNLTITKGETFYIHKATAHDVFKTSSTIYVTLKNVETEEIVFNKIDCNQTLSYTPISCGSYEITYVAKDSANRDTTRSYYIVVREDDAPIIETDEKVKETYGVNESINYIKANVVDENDVNYYMFVLQPNGKYIVVNENSKYTFSSKGEYRVILYAEDSYYNVAKIEYVINVK